jgi:hypothetical protein
MPPPRGDVNLLRRARTSATRLRIAQMVTATVLCDVPLSCVYAVCDFLLPSRGIVCVSRDSVAVAHPGPAITGERVDYTTDNGGDIADVAAAGNYLVVSRGTSFQVTCANPITGTLHTRNVSDSHAAQVVAVDITENGVVATSCVDGTIGVWDVATYQNDSTDRSVPLLLLGHTDWVRFVKFVPSRFGQLLLVSAGDDGRVCVWDPYSATCLHTAVFHAHSIRAAAAAAGPECPTVAVAVGNVAVMFRWEPGRLTESLRIQAHRVPVTAMHLTTQLVCSVSEDEEICVHRLCDAVLLVRAKARLASRLCASLMSTITKVVVFHEEPEATALVLCCCSSDGDLLVITAHPRDPSGSAVSSPRGPSSGRQTATQLAARYIDALATSAAGIVSRKLASNMLSKAATQPPKEIGPPPCDDALYRTHENSVLLETGAVVGMAICHGDFS